MLGVGEAAKQAGEETEKSQESGADAAKKTAAALRALGVKSEEVANKQIAKLREQFDAVKNSGVASAQEIERAQESMERRIKAINDSIGRDTAKTFDKIRAQARAGFGKVSGRGAAIAAGAAGAVSAGGAVATLTSAGERAREIDRATTAAGLDAKSDADLLKFQRLAFASSARFGVGIDNIGDMLKDTNDKLFDFVDAGSGGLVDFAEQIAPLIGVKKTDFKPITDKMNETQIAAAAKRAGLSVDDFTAREEDRANKQWRQAVVGTFQGADSIETFQNMAAILERIGSTEERKTFYFEAIASDSSVIADLFSNGGKELNRLGDVGQATGGFMDAEAVERMQESNLRLMKTLGPPLSRGPFSSRRTPSTRRTDTPRNHHKRAQMMGKRKHKIL